MKLFFIFEFMTSMEQIYTIFENYPRISTDSRGIEPGSIFFALKGENFNGNQFAADALKKGAAYAIVDQREFTISEKTILVDDVLQSLKNLANFHRKKLAIPVLAITGTNGKTTTKELVSAVLAKKFKTGFTQGNLNNHIGVPLTLLEMDKGTEFGVVEMGANHRGEIAELCTIAEPNYGIITNIGKAHLEGFGSFEGVKKAKAELYHYLEQNNGTVFYDSGNPILTELARGLNKKISYGTTDADFTGELLKSPPFLNLKANFRKGVLYINTHLMGDYNFENVMAAACIGNYFGVDPLEIQQALNNYHPVNNRSQLVEKNGLKITMDAYNANPTSMQASIKSFLSKVSGNSLLILGDMLELGEFSRDEHIAILELLQNYPGTQVLVVGKHFAEIAHNFNCRSFENVNQLCHYLQKNKISAGEILIKGSRGIQLEKALGCF